MISGFPNLKWLPPVVCAALCAVSQAQTQTPKHGQPIIFSIPDSEASNAPSLAPRAPGLSEYTKSFQSQPFSFNTPQTAPATEVPVVTAEQSEQFQQALDRQKNWTLMTPEEILGIPTPEQMFGISEHDASGERKNQTLTERYYERQEQIESTNGETVYGSEWIFSNRDDTATSPNFFPGLNNNEISPFNSVFSEKPDDSKNANENSGWPKGFSPPVRTSAQSAEQLEADAEFQKLLEPQPAAESTKPAGEIFSTLPKASDSIFSQPTANPIGATFAPLDSGIQRPVGVKPLPGLVEKNNSTTPVAPEWQPQLPPWMLSGPQPGVAPQRKF